MSNIEGLDVVESEWVTNAMGRLRGDSNHGIGTAGWLGICPSEAAWDRFQTNITNADFQEKNIPYK